MNRPTERSPMAMPTNDGQPKAGSLASGDIGLSPPEAPTEREEIQDPLETSVSAMDIDQREDTLPVFVCDYSIDQWKSFEETAVAKRKAWVESEGTVDFSGFFEYVVDIPFIKANFGDTIQSMSITNRDCISVSFHTGRVQTQLGFDTVSQRIHTNGFGIIELYEEWCCFTDIAFGMDLHE